MTSVLAIADLEILDCDVTTFDCEVTHSGALAIAVKRDGIAAGAADGYGRACIVCSTSQVSPAARGLETHFPIVSHGSEELVPALLSLAEPLVLST